MVTEIHAYDHPVLFTAHVLVGAGSNNGDNQPTQSQKWYWASAVANLLGVALSTGENFLLTSRTDVNGWWKSFTNGRWYPPTWEGSSLSGYKSTFSRAVKALEYGGAGLFAVGAVHSGFKAGNNVIQRDWAGFGKNGGEIAIGYIGTFGGWPGLITAGSYYAMDYTVGIETFSAPVTDGFCYVSGNC